MVCIVLRRQTLLFDKLPEALNKIEIGRVGGQEEQLAVARFNGLVDFRCLEPGIRLHFPPLV